MKTAVALLALLLAAVAPQQQTFYSAKAEPKPVPAHTAEPFNPDYLYYVNCLHGGGSWKGRAPAKYGKRTYYSPSGNCYGHRSPRTSARPSNQPAPRHS